MAPRFSGPGTFQHDVIVVGAGPAGSTAARALALCGWDVLLLDRSVFPRDKPCGDLVPFEAMALLRSLGLGPRLDAAGFYPCHTLLRFDAQGRYVELPASRDPTGVNVSSVVLRTEFDTLLWQAAQEAGARFRVASVRGLVVEDGQVVGVRVGTGDETLRAPVVLGADGSTSLVGRALHRLPPGPQHVGISLRVYVDHMVRQEHAVEFHECDGSYAWAFPTRDGVTNVGVGLRLDTLRATGVDLAGMLARFLARPHLAARMRHARVREPRTWPVNLGSCNLDRAHAGALLLGDAGWFADPLTGGGIQNAVATALMAAEVTHDALTAGDVGPASLGRYEALWRRQLGPGLAYATRLSRGAHKAVYGLSWLGH